MSIKVGDKINIYNDYDCTELIDVGLDNKTENKPDSKFGFQFEHSDFDDDNYDADVNYIEIHKGLPDRLVNAAQIIDGENFNYSCFVLIINHEKATDKFIIVDFYYIDNNGKQHYLDDFLYLFDDEMENIIKCIKEAKEVK